MSTAEAMILQHEGEFYIIAFRERYVPGPVRSWATYFDMSQDGMAGGDIVQVEMNDPERCLITLKDGTKKLWFADNQFRKDNLLPDYPKALTGGLPISTGPRGKSLCAMLHPRELPPENPLLDLDGMKALAAEQMSPFPQCAGMFDNFIAVRITRDVTTKAGPAFKKGELAIAKPEPDEHGYVVYSFFNASLTGLHTKDVEFLPEVSSAPAP